MHESMIHLELFAILSLRCRTIRFFVLFLVYFCGASASRLIYVWLLSAIKVFLGPESDDAKNVVRT